MREKLRQLGSSERHTFIGIFERYGKKRGWFAPASTVLLKDIRLENSDSILTDHVWLTVGKRLYELGELQCGDIIQFNARVAEYYKVEFFDSIFYDHDYILDFRLDRANRFKVLNRDVKSRVLMEKDNSITEKQNSLIKKIEEKLSIQFTGKTKQEASRFIQENIDKLNHRDDKI